MVGFHLDVMFGFPARMRAVRARDEPGGAVGGHGLQRLGIPGEGGRAARRPAPARPACQQPSPRQRTQWAPPPRAPLHPIAGDD